MKLILTQDVTGLGDSGDVVEVKDGYGRNFLVPRGLAIGWSKGAERQIDQIRRARQAREIRDVDHAREVKQTLEGLQVNVTAHAGDGGRLFGSVTTNDVADAIRDAGGPPLDKRTIAIPAHVKTVGPIDVHVRLHPEVTAEFTVAVVAG